MIEISSNQFRQQPNKFFDLADKGEQIVIRRRCGNSYTIAPSDDNEDYSYDEARLNEIIEQGMKDIREGRTTPYTTMEDMIARLGL